MKINEGAVHRSHLFVGGHLSATNKNPIEGSKQQRENRTVRKGQVSLASPGQDDLSSSQASSLGLSFRVKVYPESQLLGVGAET